MISAGILGIALGMGVPARAAPPTLAEPLRRAEAALATVLPDEPWAMFCQARWADTSTQGLDTLWSLVEPCEAGTLMAADFDPLPTYLRIGGDRQHLDAQLRFAALKGCWKLSGPAPAPKLGPRPPSPEEVIARHRLGAAQLVRRAVQANHWARRLLRQSRAQAQRFQEAGASDAGPLYAARIDRSPYLLAFDGEGRLRWIQVGEKVNGTRIELEPVEDALLPRRFKIQLKGELLSFDWKYQKVADRWVPTELQLTVGQGQTRRILLADCAFDGQAQGAEGRARFEAARRYPER